MPATAPGLEYVRRLSGRRGRIDAHLLGEAADGLDAPACYLCGALGMVDAARSLLAERGVPDDRVHYEEFWGYD